MSPETPALAGAYAVGVATAAGISEAVRRLIDAVSPNAEVAALALPLAGVAGAAFILMFRRYTTILGRRGPDALAAYDALRIRLDRGGWMASVYSRRLTMVLDAVDRFFG